MAGNLIYRTLNSYVIDLTKIVYITPLLGISGTRALYKIRFEGNITIEVSDGDLDTITAEREMLIAKWSAIYN